MSNLIHNLSKPVFISDFDLFSVPMTQTSIEKNIVTEHRPISTLSSDSIIEFNVDSGPNEYIQLRESYLYMKIRVDINKTGGNILEADWDKIGSVNTLLHSLFRTVNLEISRKSVTMSPQTYSYKAYFETILGYTLEAKQGYLDSAGAFDDSVAKQTLSDKAIKTLKPTNITTNGRGKSIELYGKLHLDLAFQPKALIGGTKLRISLVPNEPKFYLWATDNTLTPTVTFENAALYVTKSLLNQDLVDAHNLALMKGTAKYPIMRGYVKAFTVNAGTLDVNLDNCITGQIPRRIFVAMVKNKTFLGDLKENPYNFEDFNLNYLTAIVNGIQFPSVAFTPDFPNNLFAREYMSLFQTLNQTSTDATLDLDQSEYKGGNVIFGFAFAPDPIDDCNKTGYVNPIEHGAVKLNMKFAQALTENITVLIYCEYDNMIQIDVTRQPIIDYI